MNILFLALSIVGIIWAGAIFHRVWHHGIEAISYTEIFISLIFLVPAILLGFML